MAAPILEMSSNKSPMQEFYSNQTIFLTGATGFIGKIVLEKLLRTCPQVDKIYVLIRPKREKSAEERCKEIFEKPCFDSLKSQNFDFGSKIFPLEGDCDKPFLGLSEEVRNIVQSETTCVINSAANVRFDADLKSAVATNVRSLQSLLILSKEMKKLRAFVHVSTAFSHCCRTEIDEKFYELDVGPEKLLDFVETVDEKYQELFTMDILKTWPNTYVYTKAIAENLVRSYESLLPITIVRPAIVSCAYEEPVAGWIENFTGFAGLTCGVCLGAIRSLHMDTTTAARTVPADFVVNLILAAAWNVDRLKNKENNKTSTIYNYAGYQENLVTWQDRIDWLKNNPFKYPLSQAIWYFCTICTKHRFFYKVCVFFLHTVFSYFVDAILLILRKKPLAVTKYKRINKSIDFVSFFATRSLDFKDTNVRKLWEKLDETDKKYFSFDMSNFDWKKYYEICIVGGRIYLLNDPLSTIPSARRKMYVLATVHYTFKGLFYCFLCFVFLKVLGLFLV